MPGRLAWPVLCRRCRAITTANHETSPLRCEVCTSTSVTSVTAKPVWSGSGDIIEKAGSETVVCLTDGRYLCPVCDQLELRFGEALPSILELSGARDVQTIKVSTCPAFPQTMPVRVNIRALTTGGLTMPVLPLRSMEVLHGFTGSCFSRTPIRVKPGKRTRSAAKAAGRWHRVCGRSGEHHTCRILQGHRPPGWGYAFRYSRSRATPRRRRDHRRTGQALFRVGSAATGNGIVAECDPLPGEGAKHIVGIKLQGGQGADAAGGTSLGRLVPSRDAPETATGLRLWKP